MKRFFYIIIAVLSVSCHSVKKASQKSKEKTLGVVSNDIRELEQKDVEIKKIAISEVTGIKIIPADPEKETVIVTPDGKEHRVKNAREIEINKSGSNTSEIVKDRSKVKKKDKSEVSVKDKKIESSRSKDKKFSYWWLLFLAAILAAAFFYRKNVLFFLKKLI